MFGQVINKIRNLKRVLRTLLSPQPIVLGVTHPQGLWVWNRGVPYGHFRITLNLFLKESLGAYCSIWK